MTSIIVVVILVVVSIVVVVKICKEEMSNLECQVMLRR